MARCLAANILGTRFQSRETSWNSKERVDVTFFLQLAQVAAAAAQRGQAADAGHRDGCASTHCRAAVLGLLLACCSLLPAAAWCCPISDDPSVLLSHRRRLDVSTSRAGPAGRRAGAPSRARGARGVSAAVGVRQQSLSAVSRAAAAAARTAAHSASAARQPAHGCSHPPWPPPVLAGWACPTAWRGWRCCAG